VLIFSSYANLEHSVSRIGSITLNGQSYSKITSFRLDGHRREAVSGSAHNALVFGTATSSVDI
jgi:hypothetical protein